MGPSGSPLRGEEHLSPTATGSGLFPLKEEEKESFHGDGSVFNITFSGHIEEGVKENGDAPLRENTNGSVMPETKYHCDGQNEDKV